MVSHVNSLASLLFDSPIDEDGGWQSVSPCDVLTVSFAHPAASAGCSLVTVPINGPEERNETLFATTGFQQNTILGQLLLQLGLFQQAGEKPTPNDSTTTSTQEAGTGFARELSSTPTSEDEAVGVPRGNMPAPRMTHTA